MLPKNIGEEFNQGLSLFNRAHFFDAHEILEDVWNSVPRDAPLRRHLQGMVQLAVAFHHESTGNHVGARSVLERALRNLGGAERSFPDVDLDRLRADLGPWRRYLESPPAGLDSAGDSAEDAARDVGGGTRDIHAERPLALPKIAWRR